jgi:hypothetical protein
MARKNWNPIPPIANNQLTVAGIPPDDATWSGISKLALTFDGYEVHGSFEACGEIANARQCETIDDLRTCFFEQRRFRHFGADPRGEDLEYLRDIVGKIRAWAASRPNRNS